MLRTIVFRILQAIVTLAVVSFVVYLAGDMTGDPVSNYVDPLATEDDRLAITKELGLDKPVLYRYGLFLKNAFQGNLGKSFKTRQPVMTLVKDRLGNSLKLVLVAKAITLAVAIPLGVYAAVHRGTFRDTLARGFALFFQSAPGFWVAIMAIIVFAVKLHWLPVAGMDSWRNYVLPACIVGFGTSAGLLRILRSSMIESLQSEYVQLARAKGVSERRVVWVHALRNASIPALTFFGLSLGVAIGAAVTIEVVFAWPGLGRLIVESVTWGDYPVVLVGVIIWGAIIIGMNLIVDITYTIVDPRVRI
ncbi:MAG: ABC transporter permease [Chloroflexi bacterium]|nr:ABC transporter permease [Chloroflexota bacterium]